MRITGTLLEVEDYSGTFKGDSGDDIKYSGQRLHVLDGREVVKVKIPKNLLGLHDLEQGESVDLRVSVTASQGARGAYLTTTLVGVFDEQLHSVA